MSLSALPAALRRFAGATLAAGVIALALSACAPKDHTGLLTPVSPKPAAGTASNLPLIGDVFAKHVDPARRKRVDLLVAATRLRGDNPYGFTVGRSHIINYQSVALSIPPGHSAGAIEMPRHTPGDPDTEFVALDNQALNDPEFMRRANAAALRGGGDVTVYVHGFNTTYEEATFRVGQWAVDADYRGLPVLFTWPSRGRFIDYLTDRESVAFSRDRLEIVLRALARQPAVKRINLFAHSMGALLAMETLRQAKLRGDGEFTGKLDHIVLAAPDIDIDVFRTQLEVIGKRQRPTILLISSDDKALALSRTLAGDVERVGVVEIDSIEARNEIDRQGLTVIDLTNVKSPDDANHTKYAALPPSVRGVGALFSATHTPPPGALRIDSTGNIVPLSSIETLH